MHKSKTILFFIFSIFSLTVFAQEIPPQNLPQPPAQSIAIAKLDSTQELSNRVDILERRIAVIEAQFDVLKQALLALNTQVTSQMQTQNQLQQQMNAKEKKQFDFAFLGSFENYLQYFSGPIPNLILFLIIIIFVICRIFTCIKCRYVAKKAEDLTHQKTEICYLGNESDACIEVSKMVADRDDYDFMAGAEGSDAKLNLARFYLEKGDMEKAKGMINDVIIMGNAKQQEEAKELLKKLTINN